MVWRAVSSMHVTWHPLLECMCWDRSHILLNLPHVSQQLLYRKGKEKRFSRLLLHPVPERGLTKSQQRE